MITIAHTTTLESIECGKERGWGVGVLKQQKRQLAQDSCRHSHKKTEPNTTTMQTEQSLIKAYSKTLNKHQAKPSDDLAAKLHSLYLQIKEFRKQRFLTHSSKTGYAAKARLIIDGIGRNGKSMTPALLERHMAYR